MCKSVTGVGLVCIGGIYSRLMSASNQGLSRDLPRLSLLLRGSLYIMHVPKVCRGPWEMSGPETGQAADDLDVQVREPGICLHWYHFVRASARCLYKLHLSICRPLSTPCSCYHTGARSNALALSRSLHLVAFFSIIMLANALVESLAPSPVVPSTVSSSPYPSQ